MKLKDEVVGLRQTVNGLLYRKRIMVTLIDGDNTVVHSEIIRWIPKTGFRSEPIETPFPDGTRVVAQFQILPPRE